MKVEGPKFAAIVLAGGLSSRMKQFKPLLPLGDTTVTDFAISTFKSIGVDVFLVAGYRKEELVSHIKTPGITVIYNPDYEKGMFSSIQAGVSHLGESYRGFFMLPVDIPLVRASTINQLIDAGINHPQNIIYPVYEGRRGHPPLIPSSLIPDIINWKHEGGLKSLLESHENLALDVPANDRFTLFDIDTPEDYQQLLKIYNDL